MSIDPVIRRHERALNANDTDAILSPYSAEPVVLSRRGGAWHQQRHLVASHRAHA